ncbi:PREDICTED: uncharacterized protein LOC109240452 [Nicotiana attenuata]|uniref:uncharacterized protein LOC109240452 n=1 Tax=Nicotiana attenuata TaxID=49451 RepID=UPI0009059D8F|nr:PREDICTED: uncharacterized protein LOC109240452 [Nicotiana attenuata]
MARLEWRGALGYVPSGVVSFLKTQRMVEKGCDAYLSFVRDANADTPTVESVLVVRDFLDAFPTDLPVSFLGHVVSSEMIQINLKKIEAVQNLPRLSSATKIQSFLGLAGYYRCFVEDFSSIAAPMTILIQKSNGGELGQFSISTGSKEATSLDVQALANQFVRLNVLERVLACVVSWSSLYDRIRERRTEVSYMDSVPVVREFPEGEAKLLCTDLVWDAWEKVKLTQDQLRTARFGKKGKLSPRYIEPFEILEMIGEVDYKLALPPSLSAVHSVFHISMLQKYCGDPSHILDFSTIQLDKDLIYIEELVAILDRQVRKLRSKNIASVKVQ